MLTPPGGNPANLSPGQLFQLRRRRQFIAVERESVGPNGVEGDRRRAVVDAETGVSLSAKRYADLLRCRAWTEGGEVIIGLPDGAEIVADSPEAADGLSNLLGRHVTVRTAGAGHTVRHEFPTDLAVGEGEAFIWEPGLEGFFDRQHNKYPKS